MSAPDERRERPFERIPFGGERHREESPCPECGVYYFELHEPGCPVEECPVCGGPLVSCGCAGGAPG